MKKSALASMIALGLLAATSTQSFAKSSEGINWNYVSASYASYSYDDEEDGLALNLSPAGYFLDGSFAVHDNVFVMAEFQSVTDSLSFPGFGSAFNIDVEEQQFRLGAGMNVPVSASSDLFGAVGYTNISYDVSSEFSSMEDDLDGLFLRGGLRGKFSPSLEVYGYFTYSTYDVDELEQSVEDDFEPDEQVDDNETTVTVGARYFLTDQLSLNASYTALDEGNGYTLGMSYYF